MNRRNFLSSGLKAGAVAAVVPVAAAKPKPTAALRLLLGKEWSMGNGQCPECCGCRPSPDEDEMGWWTDDVGHELDCPLAAAIKELGGEPEMLRENTHPARKKMQEHERLFIEHWNRMNPDSIIKFT